MEPVSIIGIVQRLPECREREKGKKKNPSQAICVQAYTCSGILTILVPPRPSTKAQEFSFNLHLGNLPGDLACSGYLASTVVKVRYGEQTDKQGCSAHRSLLMLEAIPEILQTPSTNDSFSMKSVQATRTLGTKKIKKVSKFSFCCLWGFLAILVVQNHQ